MKFLFSTIISLLLTFPTLAQSKQSKKTKRITATEEVAQPAKSADLNTTSVDTIHISKGKPTLLLINVLGQNTKGYKDTREEKELQNNVWLVCPYRSEILYEIPFEDRWEYAGSTLGIKMNQLSHNIGHA